MAHIKPGVSLRALQTALILGMCTIAVLVLAFGCSGKPTTVPLPTALVDKALCSLGLVQDLPADPDQVTLGHLKAFKREYRKCLRVADAGAP